MDTRNGRFSYAHRSQSEARRRDEEACRRAVRFGHGLLDCLARPFRPQGHRETMAADIPRVRKRGAADHGRQASQVHIRAEGGRGFGRGRRRSDEGRGDGRVRHHVDDAARPMVQALPRGRGRGAQTQAEGQAQGIEGRAARTHPRAGARGALPKARGRGRLPKKKLRALVERDGL